MHCRFRLLGSSCIRRAAGDLAEHGRWAPLVRSRSTSRRDRFRRAYIPLPRSVQLPKAGWSRVQVLSGVLPLVTVRTWEPCSRASSCRRVMAGGPGMSRAFPRCQSPTAQICQLLTDRIPQEREASVIPDEGMDARHNKGRPGSTPPRTIRQCDLRLPEPQRRTTPRSGLANDVLASSRSQSRAVAATTS